MKINKTTTKPSTEIRIQLLGGKTFTIQGNDAKTTREWFEQLRVQGVVAGEAIRHIEIVL